MYPLFLHERLFVLFNVLTIILLNRSERKKLNNIKKEKESAKICIDSEENNLTKPEFNTVFLCCLLMGTSERCKARGEVLCLRTNKRDTQFSAPILSPPSFDLATLTSGFKQNVDVATLLFYLFIYL